MPTMAAARSRARFSAGLRVPAIRRRILAAAERAAPGLVALATPVLDRLASDHWELEWQLPRWLGAAYGLAADEVDALVASNVAGLAYVRLMDDLVDEGGPARVERMGLANALFVAAVSGYARAVQTRPGGVPLLLDRLDRHMGEWLRAMLAGRRSPRVADDEAALVARGAPLKIGAAAACLAAGREDVLAAVDRALDRSLLALVLLDHAEDWPADLKAGRWNAFIAHVSSGPQVARLAGRHRREVMRAMLDGGPEAYFGRIREQLQGARGAAEGAACPGLARYCAAMDRRVARYARAYATEARLAVREAAEYLFGPPAP